MLEIPLLLSACTENFLIEFIQLKTLRDSCTDSLVDLNLNIPICT
jgi:hypothetical protein